MLNSPTRSSWGRPSETQGLGVWFLGNMIRMKNEKKGILETETTASHLSSQPSSPPHDTIPPPRHCTWVVITGRAGCGATSSAALKQPKRVGSKRAARQLRQSEAPTPWWRWGSRAATIGQMLEESYSGGKSISCNQCNHFLPLE